jgi:small subunit ribosomal protein S6
MRRYEVVFVLAPTLADDEFDQQIDSYVEAAKESGAEIVDVDKWGKRRLAFPVQKHTEGYYTVLTLDEPSGKAVDELERRFKVNDAVIRFLSVRIDLELKRADKFEKRKEFRKKRMKKAKAVETQPAAQEE